MQPNIYRVALATLLAFASGTAAAQVSITATGVPVVQDFDGLPASGTATWTNDATLPGWYHARTGTGTSIVANDGVSNAGNLYSYGTGTSSERALGSLGSGNAAVGSMFWGVRLRNDTGQTITSLEVEYVGEQWRNSAAAAQSIAFSYLVGSPAVTGSLAEFQTAGVAVPGLDFTGPVSGGTAGPLNGGLAANRVARSATLTGLSIPAGGEIMLRWSDPDQSGADHGLAIDDVRITALGEGPSLPALSVGDVTVFEGDAGTTVARFTISLANPGSEPVTFDLATADGNATTADSDYVPLSFTGQTYAAAAFPVTVDVLVNGDTRIEPNEGFYLDVTNVVGANVADGKGFGAIVNDDFEITPISAIQGPGATSPLVGATVHTTGVVTGRKSNGFFLQTPDAMVDADPATSEGIFVFTGAAPPAAATVGNRVRVSGTVIEFVPASDRGQAPLTEIGGGPTVTLLEAPEVPVLPMPVVLSATFPDPAGPFDQLERVEGMLVTIADATVVAPTGGFTNEPNASGTGNGAFSVVVTGVARPFREPGIQMPDAPPGGGSIPPIPRWDFNPELIAVDSDALGAPALDLAQATRLADLTGPLDYGFRRYTVLPSPLSPPTVQPGTAATPRAAALPEPGSITVAGYNLERFFDTVNDPGIGEPVLTAAAFERRLAKASLGIREYLHLPDVLGTVEVENLSTLQALASRVNADAVAAGRADPNYVAHLIEGNDVGGIDVGFLVKTAPVAPGTPRVEVVSVAQVGKDTLWTEPDGSTSLLNDRPPLALEAVVHDAGGSRFPMTVVVVHQRSLNGAETDDDSGARVRSKRQRQAEFLAAYLDARQKADPTLRMLVLGDFNAFEFNDGLAHTMGTVTGLPAADAETAVLGDGADLVETDLVNLGRLEPQAERYSFVFGGNAQTLDHVLVNEELVVATRDIAMSHARINADFPEIARNDADSPSRLSDHDPVVAILLPRRTADLAVSATGRGARLGEFLTFDVQVGNDGPEQADFPGVGFELDAELPGLTVRAPAAWACEAPEVAAGRTRLACAADGLAVDADAAFGLDVPAEPALVGRSLTLVAVVQARSLDANAANDAATASAAVGSVADLSVALEAMPFQPSRDMSARLQAVVRNRGPDAAARPQLTIRGPGRAADVAFAAPSGWSCSANDAPGGFDGSCTAESLRAGGTVTVDVVARVSNLRRPVQARFRAQVQAAGTDPVPANDSASRTVLVVPR